ncbi:MAG: hypothetical protein WEA58_12955 [Balneolaceae bacterium]
MKTKLKAVILLFTGLIIFSTDAYSQLNISAEAYNRYVWRGTDFGSSPSIQPDINYSSGNFEVGTWAAFATTGDPDGTEVDFYASYLIDTNAGGLSLSITDYTFPDLDFNNYFSSNSHFIELGVGYSGPESFPITLSTGIFVTNDDDNSIYSEIGYDIRNVSLFLGFTPTESALYGTTGSGVINTGFSVSRDVPVTELFSISLNGTVVANPYSDNLYFLAGIGF